MSHGKREIPWAVYTAVSLLVLSTAGGLLADPDQGEGFVVINHNQQKYTGKFWTKDEMKIPPGEMLEFRPV